METKRRPKRKPTCEAVQASNGWWLVRHAATQHPIDGFYLCENLAKIAAEHWSRRTIKPLLRKRVTTCRIIETEKYGPMLCW